MKYRLTATWNGFLTFSSSFPGGVCFNHVNIMLTGDFNLTKISWNSPEPRKTRKIFTDLHDYLVLLNSATRVENRLDPMTNILDLVKVCRVSCGSRNLHRPRHNQGRPLVSSLSTKTQRRQLPSTVYFCSIIYREYLDFSATASVDSHINEDWKNFQTTFLDVNVLSAGKAKKPLPRKNSN